MRDSLGRFIVGHGVVAHRDNVTGRFISDKEVRYRITIFEIERFLSDSI